MTMIQELTQRLANASDGALVALSTACAARVLPVFDTYWEGDHSDAPRRTIELGWAVAEGAPADLTTLRKLKPEVGHFVAYYNEESIGILASTVTAALRVCECLEAPDRPSRLLAVARACGSSLHVALLADKFINGLQPIKGGPAETEERQWQSDAVAIAGSWREPHATRDMFAGVGPMPPAWWSLYQAAPHHI